MRNWWIRFGCFIIGYNYNIVRASSEVAAKAVKRYTSAMVIICVIWAFVGYMFTNRYLKGGAVGSVLGAVLMVILIVQIERQIILSVKPGAGLYIARGCIAFMMAIIGAIIVDQMIFKEDIELEKITFLDRRIKEALPPKTEELNRQIHDLDSMIRKKEEQLTLIREELSKRPYIKTTVSHTTPTVIKKPSTDPVTGQVVYKDTVIRTTSVVVANAPNPKHEEIPAMNDALAQFRAERASKSTMLVTIRPQIEEELKGKTGFLDEMEVMYSLISKSAVALGFWLLWVILLLALELLVLFNKAYDKGNDYDRTVLHHEEIQIKRLEALARTGATAG